MSAKRPASRSSRPKKVSDTGETRKAPRLTGVLIAIVIGVLGAIALQSFDIGSFFFERTRTGGSQSVLIGMEDTEDLETLAYVRRTVFPHDFLSDDYTMLELIDRVARTGESPESVLPRDAYLHYTAANLAADVGLATRRDQTRYVVVTSEYRFGYRVSELTDHLSRGNTTPDSLATVVGALPPARILSVTTEDIDPQTYPFGPVPLDAEEWSAVAAFTVAAGLTQDEIDRLESRSRGNTAELLRSLTVTEDLRDRFD